MKQSSWLVQLRQNTAVALSMVGNIRPERIESAAIEQRQLRERLDTLKCSESFFLHDYAGGDKEQHLEAIRSEAAELENRLSAAYPVRTIAELNRQDPEILNDCLTLMVNDLRLFFQVDNMITNKGIEALCTLIIAKYKHFTLEEVAICFSEAKEGEYGKSFNRLDAAMIMLWLKKANEDKIGRQKEWNYGKEINFKAGASEGRTTVVNNSELLLEAQLKILKEGKFETKK